MAFLNSILPTWFQSGLGGVTPQILPAQRAWNDKGLVCIIASAFRQERSHRPPT